MSVFRYKGSKVWTMDFIIHSQRIREINGHALQDAGHRRSNASAGASWRKERQAFASASSRNCSPLPRMNGWRQRHQTGRRTRSPASWRT